MISFLEQASLKNQASEPGQNLTINCVQKCYFKKDSENIDIKSMWMLDISMYIQNKRKGQF